MTQFTTAARTGICEKCQASHTYVLSVQALGDGAANRAPYSCPKCGHVGTLEGRPGQQIVRVKTKLYAG